MKAIIVIGRPNEQDFVSGVSKRFREKLELIQNALTEKLNFDKKDIFILEPDGTPGSGEKFKKDMESIFSEYSKENICLFYAGHGQENGWGLSGYKDVEAMTYDQLALILSCHYGSLILVNFCCFAGAAKASFEHRIGEWLMIAAMPEGRSDSAYNFCRIVMEHWANQKFFDPHVVKDNTEYIPPVEGKESLQSLLFSNQRSVL